ncbi:hypothetical protein D3C72_1961910 [compost metagenome]
MLPPACSCVFKNRLPKNGTNVKATIIEANTLVITAIGRLLINSPETSGRKASGKKAITSVAVHPTTASPICFVPFKTASILECPSLSQRSMFSTTTILSSTRSPNATTKPTILS